MATAPRPVAARRPAPPNGWRQEHMKVYPPHDALRGQRGQRNRDCNNKRHDTSPANVRASCIRCSCTIATCSVPCLLYTSPSPRD
eukprot:169681-Alexandrium_andersonii.AAC.1